MYQYLYVPIKVVFYYNQSMNDNAARFLETGLNGNRCQDFHYRIRGIRYSIWICNPWLGWRERILGASRISGGPLDLNRIWDSRDKEGKRAAKENSSDIQFSLPCAPGIELWGQL